MDPQATAAYRARLRELDDEIEAATADADLGRAAHAREERELIAEHLSAAYGLGRRARKLGDPAERLRKAVRNKIRRALERIDAAHPALGGHLKNSLRTGLLCVYRPERPVEWEF